MSGGGFATFFEPVTVAADVDDGGPVQQPVQRGASHNGIAGEDVRPIAEGFIAGQHDRGTVLVAVGDDLEEQAGFSSHRASGSQLHR